MMARPNFHPRQQCVRVHFCPCPGQCLLMVFLMTVVLAGERWELSVLLVHRSLKASEVVLFPVFIAHLYFII